MHPKDNYTDKLRREMSTGREAFLLILMMLLIIAGSYFVEHRSSAFNRDNTRNPQEAATVILEPSDTIVIGTVRRDTIRKTYVRSITIEEITQDTNLDSPQAAKKKLTTTITSPSITSRNNEVNNSNNNNHHSSPVSSPDNSLRSSHSTDPEVETGE